MRIQIGNHLAQLNVGDGAVVLTELRQHARHSQVDAAQAVMVRVDDAGGHHWTFSQSIADVDPTDWGGTPGVL